MASASATRSSAPWSRQRRCRRSCARPMRRWPRWSRARSGGSGLGRRRRARARQAEGARRRGTLVDAVAAMERSATLTPDPKKRAERVVIAAEIAYEAGLVDQVRSLLADLDPPDLPPRKAARVDWLRLLLAGNCWDGPGAARTFARLAERIAAGGGCDLAPCHLLSL